jgi:phosphoribosyl 1,2-cyclic phosphate phosphodiesterase
MKITFLGTGTSSGVPVLTCNCEVCHSTDIRDKRLRVSILIETQTKNIVVDAGPDFRQQLLQQGISQLDAIVFTHEHKDHTAGLDDVRPFNYLMGKREMPIYAHQRVINQLKQEYYYAFQANAYPGVPILQCIEIENAPFSIGDVNFIPIDLLHHKLQVFGYRIGDFTYITDANFIADIELEKVKGSKVLVLNALQRQPHLSHFNLDQAIEIAQAVQADRTFFTHISHKMGKHIEVNATLPPRIGLAYDGLSFEL